METQDYQSLTDPHLNAYFNNKRIRRHLIKTGFINRHGDILPSPTYEVVLAKRTKRKEAKEKLSHTIINYVIEEERKRQAFVRDQFDFAVKRSRIQKIRESKQQQQLSLLNTLVQVSKQPKDRSTRSPSPTLRKRSSTRAKSAHPPTKNVTYQLARRPPSAKTSKDDFCEVTMIYYGPQLNIEHDNKRIQPNGDEVIVMQQHCGGENLIVFKGFVNPNETFTFESRRHPGYPFAVAIYINGLIDSRISVCCEYKHKHNVRLGSTHGLFGIYDVRKSRPCLVCQYARRNQKILLNPDIPDNSSRYRKSVVLRSRFSSEHGSGDILRTPESSPQRHEQPSKERIVRISTEAQASPRTRSPTSPRQKDEHTNNISTSTSDNKSSTTDQKQINKSKDNNERISRVSSSTSKKSGPSSATVSFQNDDPLHSSAPILTTKKPDVKKKDNHSSRSSTSTSTISGAVATHTSNDKVDRRKLRSLSTASLEPPAASKATPPLPASILNKEHGRRKLNSPSTTSLKSTSSPVPIPNKKHSHQRLLSSSSESDHSPVLISNKKNGRQRLVSTSSESDHSPVRTLKSQDDHQRIRSSSSASSKSRLTPVPMLKNEKSPQLLRSPSISTSDSGSVPVPIYNDDDDRQSLRSSSTSTKKSSPSPPAGFNYEDNQNSPKILSKKDDDTRDHFFSSPSISTSKERDSSLADFFVDKKNDHQEKIDTPKKTSRSLSNNSKLSDSSTKIKPVEKSNKEINDSYSSSSSSTKKSVDRVLPLDNQYEKQCSLSTSSSDENEGSHHSIKNEPEPYRTPTPSIDNQQTKKDINESDDDDDSKSTPIVTPKRRNEDEEPLATKSEKKTIVRQYHSAENIIVIWLDANVDKNTDDVHETERQLRQIARTIRTFTDPEKCLQLIKEIKHEKILLIVSGKLSEDVLPQIDPHSQVAVIYIFCQQNSKYEHLTIQYPKIKNIYTDISRICEDLKTDAKQWDNDLSTFQVTSSINDDYKQLTSEQLLFIQNQLFKEFLLEIKYNEFTVECLVDYCEHLYKENEDEKKLIKQFQEEYKPNDALLWYTKDCFIYHMLNKAIRMKDIKHLYEMSFFIHDINQQLENIHSTTVHRSTQTVFRGQGMKLEYFEELKQNQDGLISFNGFVSTSMKQSVAYDFAKRSLTNGFPVAVLFRMKIDPKTTSNPYAALENRSANQFENEILFSFKTIFHIESIEQIENNLWQIDLNLIHEKENNLIHCIQIEREKFNHFDDYEKIGELLIEMNEFDKAKDVYELNLPSINHPKYTHVYNQLALIATKLDAYNDALFYYDLGLRTKSNESLNDYVTISYMHNQMGKIFYKQNKFREALEKFQYALNIQLEHLSAEHPALADTYASLAMVSEDNDDYQTALDYYEKQLQIQEKLSPSNQSDLALTHYKIAICLENLERLNEAMDHIKQSIDITPSDDMILNQRQIVLERIREQLE